MNQGIDNPYLRTLYEALLYLEDEGLYRNTIVCVDENGILIGTTCQPSVGQYPAHDVKESERIVFEILPGRIIPYPYFNRPDFPRVPHLLRNTGSRKYPCMYTAHDEQIALYWNALTYAVDLYGWLNRLAAGTLQEEGEPLEDVVLVTEGYLLLPLDYYARPDEYTAVTREEVGSQGVYRLSKTSGDGQQEYLIKNVRVEQVPHSGIQAGPASLAELQELVDSGTSDFSVLRFLSSAFQDPSQYSKRLMFVVDVEVVDADTKSSDRKTYAFTTHDMVGDIGVLMSALGESPDQQKLFPIMLALGALDLGLAESVPLYGLLVSNHFNLLHARRMNGRPYETRVKAVVQIGVGALGSQVARNLTQSGLTNEWLAIDNDILLPHNLCRFVMTPSSVGESKVNLLCRALNEMLEMSHYAIPCLAKIEYGSLDDQLKVTIQKGKPLLVDTSASIAVQRTLDQTIGSMSSRVTAFLSPNGKSLALWYTSEGCATQHTMLEAYYYSYLINYDELTDLLTVDRPGFTYGGDSCRSISHVLSTHHVSLFSGVASQAIQSLSDVNQTASQLWVIDDEINIRRFSPRSAAFVLCEAQGGSFNVRIAPHLIDILRRRREDALPRETGGVLVGMVDRLCHTIYVTDELSAPPDSSASSRHFHRGMEGVEDRLAEIGKVTHENLVYVGEWHSHPAGAKAAPSMVDQKQLEWLREQSLNLSYPCLMLIVGHEELDLSF